VKDIVAFAQEDARAESLTLSSAHTEVVVEVGAIGGTLDVHRVEFISSSVLKEEIIAL
jgi:hypothetical protein